MEVVKNKKLSDFIGEEIKFKVHPFQFSSAYAALERKLNEMVKDEAGFNNGILTDFTSIKTTIINNEIFVSGVIKQCEVDC